MPITTAIVPINRRQSQDVFDANLEANLNAQIPRDAEFNALEANVNAKEIAAQDAADRAAASAVTALTGANAAMWVSGSYNTGAVVWSPADPNKGTYRAITTGNKPTDPYNDAVNWTNIITSSAISHTGSGAGEVATTVKNKLIEQKSILDFMTLAQRADILAFTFALDVSIPFQAAINWLSNNPNKNIKAPAGGYRLDQNIYAIYDATLNPNFNSISLQGGSISVGGDGRMDVYDYKNATYNGTVFKFANNKGLVTANAGVQKTWNQRWTDLSVVGNTTGILWDANWSPRWSVYNNLLIGNANTTTTGTAFLCGDSWTSTFANMHLVGRSDLTTGTAGEGFVFQPNTSGGGNNLFMNITGSYFGASALRFGNDYDGAKNNRSDWSLNNTVINCQGQYSGVGAKFKHRFHISKVEGYWGEQNTIADIQIDNSGGMLEFKKGVVVSNAATCTANIILGNNTGTSTTDACTDIVIDGVNMPCANTAGHDIPSIYKHTAATNITIKNCSVSNGGSTFIATPVGDVGGEVILENNDYFPLGSASELPVAKRYCSQAGAVFTDTSYMLRVADFQPTEYAGSVLNMTGWRYTPERLNINTPSNSCVVIMPSLASSLNRDLKCKIYKNSGANYIAVDVATNGATIKGLGLVCMSSAYAEMELGNRGGGIQQWNMTTPQSDARGTLAWTAVAAISKLDAAVCANSKVSFTPTNAAAANLVAGTKSPYLTAATIEIIKTNTLMVWAAGVVTVTSVAHGYSTGNSIHQYGNTPAAYDGTYTITKLTNDTYTYPLASDPGANTVLGKTLKSSAFNLATADGTVAAGTETFDYVIVN